jgi:hypothetical protein
MAKKRKRRKAPRLTEAQMVRPDPSESLKFRPKATKAHRDLQEEYQYVTTDLGRIAIIAVVMLAIMVVLALVLI